VEQLLTLARLDPDLPQVREPVALRPLLDTALADGGHLAAQRNLRVELEDGSDCAVPGNEEAIAILLRNLVNNAFRYAAPGSVVRLVLLQGDGEVVLTIDNDCEPLSEAEFAQLGQRFYRVPGSEGVGSGLGLSIVTRIAELHEATIETGPGEHGRGFRATVRFTQLA
jgi:signal transduction histidine kinase